MMIRTIRRLIRFGVYLLATLVFFSIGWYSTDVIVRLRDQQERATVTTLVMTVASNISSRHVAALSGSANDLTTPAYHELRDSLLHIKSVNAQVRYVYLFGQQNNKVVFLVDAENMNSEDFSPPGQEYPEASPQLKQSFIDGKAFVEGPMKDRWGIWVSGLAPIRSRETGQVIAIFGMDIDARNWTQTLLAYRYFGVGLTLLGVVLLALAFVNAERMVRINYDLRKEVADRRLAEEALRESEERYRSLIELTPDIIYRLNEDGTIAFISAAITQLGYAAEELVGVPFESIIHPDDRGITGRGFVEYRVGDRRMKDLEVRLIAKEDAKTENTERGATDPERVTRDFEMVFRTITLHARGHWDVPDAEITRPEKKFICTQGIARDVTERRKADEQVRKLSLAIEASSSTVVITNLDGVIEYANPAFHRVTGYTLEEALGQNPRLLQSGVHPKSFYEEMWRTLFAGEVWYGEICNKKKNGDLYWEYAAIAPVRDMAGHITHFVAIKEDITERKRADEELRVAKDAAESANRAKSTFLANMSHEIRTPMNAILGFTQLLARDSALTPTQRQHLETISRSGEHLLALINDILEMSKIEAGRVTLTPTTFDLRALLDDLMMMFRVRTDTKKLWLTLEIADDVPRYIVTDEGKLRQMLINLIGNAVKFTVEGGVAVRIDVARDGASVQRLRVVVADTGPGMPADELGKLFRPFIQTSTGARKEGGTGLGLAISREFAHLMHGEILVVSQEGVGSEFTVDIQIEEGNPVAAEQKKEARRVIGMQTGPLGMRVLIADDREENCHLLCHLLTAVGFQTLAVGNGAEALQAIDDWHPQLVLMDLQMPVMDGYEAIRRIRARVDGAAIPIIAITASALTENRESMQRSGADDFIGKPFREAELFEIIGRLLKIEYRYADSTAPTQETATVALSRDALAAFPPELQRKMRTAALDADRDYLLGLIAEVAAVDTALAESLRAMAQRFDYEGLLDLLTVEENV